MNNEVRLLRFRKSDKSFSPKRFVSADFYSLSDEPGLVDFYKDFKFYTWPLIFTTSGRK